MELNYQPWKWFLTCGMSHNKSCSALDAKAKLVVVIVFNPATWSAPAPRTSWQQRELNNCNNSARWRHKLGAMTVRSVAQTQYSATIFSKSSTVLKANWINYNWKIYKKENLPFYKIISYTWNWIEDKCQDELKVEIYCRLDFMSPQWWQRWQPSGILCYVVSQKQTDVSEDLTASIKRLTRSLMIEVVKSSETSIHFYENTWHNTLEGCHLHTAGYWQQIPPNVMAKSWTLLLHIQKSQVQILVQRPAILTEVYHGFPQSLQVNSGIVLYS
jgi:hypothetical protein